MSNDVVREIISASLRLCSEQLDAKTDLDESALEGHLNRKESVRKLALVNRQFRDVLYGMAECYNDVGYDRSALGPSAQISARMNKCGLDLCLSWNKISGEKDLNEAVSLCAPCGRIRDQLLGPRTDDDSRIQLPRLRTIRTDADERVTKRLLLKLVFPELRKVRVSQLKSFSVFGRDVLTGVTRLDLGCFVLSSMEQMDNLLETLSETSALHSLKVQFEALLNTSTTPSEISRRDIDLSHLKVLKVLARERGGYRISGAETSEACQRLLSHFITSLIVPKVEELTLDWKSEGLGNLSFWQEFPMTKVAYPSLLELNLSFTCPPEALQSHSFTRDQFGRLPSRLLRHLPTVKVCRIALPSVKFHADPLRLAQLHELHIRCITGTGVKELEKTLIAVFSQEVVDLKAVRITCEDESTSIPTDAAYWNNRMQLMMPSSIRVIFS